MSGRNREPAPVPWAEKAKAWGIDLSAVKDAAAATPDGPVLRTCGLVQADGKTCLGSLRLGEQEGPSRLVSCDRCSYEAAVPVRQLDPSVGRQDRLKRAGVPARFLGVPFERTADNSAALDAIKTWLAEYDGHVDPDTRLASLIPSPALFGMPGVGKSHLLAAISVRLVERDLRVLFRSARQLLRELQRFEDPAELDRSRERALRADVLVLDDVGAHQDTEWRHEQLADLVDERYQTQRPIVLATNFAPSTWERVMDERIRSRLLGMTFAIEVAGEDRRVHDRTQLALASNTIDRKD